LLQRLRVRASAQSVKRLRRLRPAQPALSWRVLQADARYRHARALQSDRVSG